MAAQGQSFFQASGDDDAYTGANMLDNASVPNTPVDSPNVISVGGTTLRMSGTGDSWAAEAVWNYHDQGGTNANTGSGGGISAYYPIPFWQTNINMSFNAGSTFWRNIPDVALTADQIYVTYDNGNSGGFAGTSCAAPLWAGFCALVNQFSVSSGQSTVGFLNPALYETAKGQSYFAFFHDITTGNNTGTNTPGLFKATARYDLCTGLGTPNGTNLINALLPFPRIILEPVSQTITNGDSASFTVQTAGRPPLDYQWLFNRARLADAVNVSGAASNVLTLAGVTSSNAGEYMLVANNSYASATSRVASLTVIQPATLTVPLSSITTQCGSNIVLSVSAEGTPPLAYQWSLDGAPVADATNAELPLARVTSEHVVTVVVTNLYGGTTSSADLMVEDTLCADTHAQWQRSPLHRIGQRVC